MLNKSEDLLLVDTRPFSEYSMGHIQGAVNIDLFQFHWLDSSKVGIKQFVRQSRILLSNIGVRNEKSVVFYDNISGMSVQEVSGSFFIFPTRRCPYSMEDLKSGKKRGTL